MTTVPVIEVDPSSVQAFIERGRSESFSLSGKLTDAKQLGIRAMIDGQETIRIGYLIRAGGRRSHSYVIKKRK